MAEADATQCGFCTPGFVMSAYAFAAGGEPAELDTIHDALAGNLCRCTGYRPIVEAMTKVAGVPSSPPSPPAPRTARPRSTEHSSRRARSPNSWRCGPAHPDALLLAGGTDLGLLASRSRKPPEAVIHRRARAGTDVDRREARSRSRSAPPSPTRGAMPVLIEAFPALRTYLARLGSRQIRTLGTIGGNIGTASPIGDMPPVLLALETTAEARLACAARASCRWRSSSSATARPRWRPTR